MTSVVNRSGPALWLAFFLVLLTGCERAPQPVRLQGSVFATGWSLVYVPEEGGPEAEAVRAELQGVFDLVNRSMNSYDPTSTLGQFNNLPAGEAVEVDWDFAYVFNEARTLTEITDGSYDVTVSPLLALWGFGPQGPEAFPAPEAIEAAKAQIGLARFDWESRTRMLSKRVDGASLEFSSIAKGYAVDLAGDALDELGIRHFMFEIGGEMQLRGKSPRGDAWRVAIERPDTGRPGIQAAIALTDTGVATSGDYRNYFERDGKRYSHLIDPRTGYPIEHDLVSATVVHPSTALADAWATALCIMGTERSLALAEARNVAVYLVQRQGDELIPVWSSAFEPYLASMSGEATTPSGNGADS